MANTKDDWKYVKSQANPTGSAPSRPAPTTTTNARLAEQLRQMGLRIPASRGPADEEYYTSTDPVTRRPNTRRDGRQVQGPRPRGVPPNQALGPRGNTTQRPLSDPYTVAPNAPATNPFTAAANRWGYKRPKGQGTRYGDINDTKPWNDYPSDMDATPTYVRQAKAGRPRSDIKNELERRASKRAEAMGGLGEYSALADYMTEGEKSFWNTETYTTGDMAADNLKSVWHDKGVRTLGTWSEAITAGKGNFTNPLNDEYWKAREAMDYASESNAKIIETAVRLRGEYWQRALAENRYGTELPYPRADLVPLEMFMQRAEEELGIRLVMDPGAEAYDVLEGNISKNIRQVPGIGGLAGALGATLDTAVALVEGVGRSIWSVPAAYDPASGRIAVPGLIGVMPEGDDVTIISAGEYASSFVHANTEMLKAGTVPPWQWTEQANPFVAWSDAQRNYVARTVNGIYSIGPSAGGKWNPDDAGQVARADLRAATSTLLSFSGVESQEAAIATVLGREEILAGMTEQLNALMAVSTDMSISAEARANAAYNAAMAQIEINQLSSATDTEIINSNIDPWRDALMSIATDVTLWNELPALLGLTKSALSPYARRFNRVEASMMATEDVIAANVGEFTSTNKLQSYTRPASKQVNVEVKDARALTSYVLQGVTHKQDVPVILQALVDDPKKFFTQGIPVESIVSPALKGLVENGFVKFPNVLAQSSAGAIDTLKLLTGQFANLPSVNVADNLSLLDVINQVTDAVKVFSADKLKTSNLPFPVVIGAADARAASYVNSTTKRQVHVVEILDGNTKSPKVLNRRSVASQQVAEAAAKQVKSYLKGATPVKVDPLTKFGDMQRTYASLVYLAAVPGSWVTNAISANINIMASGLGNLMPIDEVTMMAERAFGQVPYDYLERGGVDNYFMKLEKGSKLDKLRQIRSGMTPVPLTGGRVGLGENANKTKAWGGGFRRFMRTSYNALWSNSIDPQLTKAGFTRDDKKIFKAALHRMASTADLDAFNAEMTAVFGKRTPSFNPGRYGTPFQTVLRPSAVDEINAILSTGSGRFEEVAAVIDREIDYIANSVGTDVSAATTANVTADTLDSVKEVAKLSEEAAKAGDMELASAAKATANVFEESRAVLRASFDAALASGTTNVSDYVTEVWDRLYIAKREAYEELNDLANDIRASGNRGRWGAEYREAKLRVWSEYAQETVDATNDALVKMAEGTPPALRVQAAFDNLIKEAPAIGSKAPKALKGERLEELIETFREYRLYYQQEYFAAAAKSNDIRSLDIFLSTSSDIARREEVLWARIDGLQSSIDAAVRAGDKAAIGRTIAAKKAFVAPEHYKFTRWAAAKWRAATEYLNYSTAGTTTAVTFSSKTYGELSIVQKSGPGEYVARDAKGATRIISASQVPPNVARSFDMRQAYLAKMSDAINAGGFMTPRTPVAPIRTAGAPAGNIVSFKTAKGSVYQVNADGTTVRTKAARPEHPGDSGLKDVSARTIYVAPGDVTPLSMGLGKGSRYHFDDKTSTLWVVMYNEAAGKMGATPSMSNIPFTTTPAIGYTPIEVWDPVVRHNTLVYRVSHMGNPITEVASAAPSTPKPAAPIRTAGSGQATSFKSTFAPSSAPGGRGPDFSKADANLRWKSTDHEIYGWKIHLSISDQNKPSVEAFLKKNDLLYKIERSGQDGKNATVYIGSRNAVVDMANRMEAEIGQFLDEPWGEVLKDDVPITPKAWVRFDLNSRPEGIVWQQYGAQGLPFLREDTFAVLGKGMQSSVAFNRSNAELINTFGDFYLGTGVSRFDAKHIAGGQKTPTSAAALPTPAATVPTPAATVPNPATPPAPRLARPLPAPDAVAQDLITPESGVPSAPSVTNPMITPTGERFFEDSGKWYWQTDERANPVAVTKDFAEGRAGVSMDDPTVKLSRVDQIVTPEMVATIGTRKKNPITLSTGQMVAKEGDVWWIKTDASPAWQASTERESRLLIANANKEVKAAETTVAPMDDFEAFMSGAMSPEDLLSRNETKAGRVTRKAAERKAKKRGVDDIATPAVLAAIGTRQKGPLFLDSGVAVAKEGDVWWIITDANPDAWQQSSINEVKLLIANAEQRPPVPTPLQWEVENLGKVAKGEISVAFQSDVESEAFSIFEELKRASEAEMEVPSVATANNDTIDLLRQLKTRVRNEPDKLASSQGQLMPNQMKALMESQREVRSNFRKFAEAASVFGDKMQSFTMIDTTGTTWMDSLMSIPFPFHTFQTRTLKNMSERMASQPLIRHIMNTESKLYEHENGDLAKEYVEVEVGGQMYRVYVGMGKYMMSISDYSNPMKYHEDDVGTASDVAAIGASVGASPYPWIDLMNKRANGQTPYFKGYEPHIQLLYNWALGTFGTSVPMFLMEERDINRITDELALMVKEDGITQEEAQYAAAHLRHLKTGEPLPEFLKEKKGNYASILDTAMSRVGKRQTMSGGTQMAFGITVVPRTASQDALAADKQTYRDLAFPGNVSGGATAQREHLDRNPHVAVSWTRYRITDLEEESPAIGQRRTEAYDTMDVIYANMAKAVVETLVDKPALKAGKMNDLKRPFYDEIDKVREEFGDVLDGTPYARNLAKLNPHERAIFELEAMLNYEDQPPYPADDATALEKVDGFEAIAEWKEARLDAVEARILQVERQARLDEQLGGGTDPWVGVLLKYVKDEYASELLRKYKTLKNAGAEEKNWSDHSSVIEERRDVEWEKLYEGVASRMSPEAAKAAKLYGAMSDDERKKYREANPSMSEVWAAMYNPVQYDQVIGRFGANAWDTYRDYKDALPEYPGQNASDSATARYYDEVDKVNAKYKNGYELRLWIDGRWRWWYEAGGQTSQDGKYGGDYQEAVALFGEGIFEKYKSENGWKLPEVKAFNVWRNEFQDKPAGATPPPAANVNPLLNETEDEYDINEFNADYVGPRPVGSDREPVISTAAGKWDAAVAAWRAKGNITPQDFWAQYQAAAGDPAKIAALMKAFPEYAALMDQQAKAVGGKTYADYLSEANKSGYSSSRGRTSGGYDDDYYRRGGGGGWSRWGGGGGGGGVSRLQPFNDGQFQPQGLSGPLWNRAFGGTAAPRMSGGLWASVLEKYGRLR